MIIITAVVFVCVLTAFTLLAGFIYSSILGVIKLCKLLLGTNKKEEPIE